MEKEIFERLDSIEKSLSFISRFFLPIGKNKTVKKKELIEAEKRKILIETKIKQHGNRRIKRTK